MKVLGIDEAQKHSHAQCLKWNENAQLGEILNIGQLTFVGYVSFFEMTLHRVGLDWSGKMAQVYRDFHHDRRVTTVPLQREHQAFFFVSFLHA